MSCHIKPAEVGLSPISVDKVVRNQGISTGYIY